MLRLPAYTPDLRARRRSAALSTLLTPEGLRSPRGPPTDPAKHRPVTSDGVFVICRSKVLSGPPVRQLWGHGWKVAPEGVGSWTPLGLSVIPGLGAWSPTRADRRGAARGRVRGGCRIGVRTSAPTRSARSRHADRDASGQHWVRSRKTSPHSPAGRPPRRDQGDGYS